MVLYIKVITGSIARSAKRRYLSYSEADFKVFTPCRSDMLHRSGVKFGMEEGTSPPPCQISPLLVHGKGIGTQN